MSCGCAAEDIIYNALSVAPFSGALCGEVCNTLDMAEVRVIFEQDVEERPEDLVRCILFSEDDLETGVGERVNELCHVEKCW